MEGLEAAGRPYRGVGADGGETIVFLGLETWE